MEQINGYYRVAWQGNRAICYIFAPKSGGRPVAYKDVSNFLSRHGITGYKEYDLHQAIQAGQDLAVPLCQGDGLEFSESVDTIVSLDKMKISLILTPPTQRGRFLTKLDIMSELSGRGVRYGIDEVKIDEVIQNPIFNTEIVVAEGRQPRHGQDAKVEYLFNVNPTMKPKHNEDGTVDYHTLNTISHVQQGQCLAKLHPLDKGEPGYDIFGKRIMPRTVRNKRLEYGKNISISEDGTEIYSDVTGHVSLQGGKVFVSNVFEVSADVDASTGDITYSGSVEIRGSVRGGYTVIADGNIVVNGAVEDALLQAGGDIIVRQGIQGMQTGVLDAQGNVITKYIENAKVFAGGYVETGSIIYSEVSAGEDIIVAEKKGFINGGVIRAGGKLEANSIGSSMGSQTIIEVGMPPEKKARYNELKRSIDQYEREIEKIKPVIDKYMQIMASGKELDPKNRMYFNQLVAHTKEVKGLLKKAKEEISGLSQEALASNHAKVRVNRDIYPGTIVTISDKTVAMKSKRSFCSIEKKNGEIIIQTL